LAPVSDKEQEPLPWIKEKEMKKSNWIAGIVCLAIAGLLAVLNSTLPAESLMFMVGDQNMPWVPPAILGVVGAVLLATAFGREETTNGVPPTVIDEEKAVLNKRLERMGWGFFLIMLGGFALVPHEIIAKGVWSIGVGIIMLGLNVARYLNQIKMSGFTTFLGAISLLSGILQLFGLNDLGGALLLIILGAYLIVKPWFDKRQLFGKAEEGIPPAE
jgi:hypothetical protein